LNIVGRNTLAELSGGAISDGALGSVDGVAVAVPIIDISVADAATRIAEACRNVGFFAVRLEKGLDRQRAELISIAKSFFGLPTATKELVSMERGGPAWRGWFPLGGELTSGKPDLKEGYYFGAELPPDARPMHGPNLWPISPLELEAAVTKWMAAMLDLGQRLLSIMAVGLQRSPDFFANGLTAEPTPLFRIFRYPPHPAGDSSRWGVGEHADYGLLTLLATDGTPGLEVMVDGFWIPVPAEPDLIICNLGDMLDRLTGGRYRSTRHRVRNHAGADRYSMPFFLDPGWDASVQPLDFDDAWVTPQDAHDRWDRANVRTLDGTYGQWLTAKVTKVFPALATETRLTNGD
jgi:isopenicillin N synthase-like dioxygenase